MQAIEVNRIRVSVAHVDPILTTGLAATLRDQSDILVDVLEPGGAAQAHVTIADLDRGLHLLGEGRQGKYASGIPRVLVLARQAREYEVRLALEAGVQGFVVQDCALDDIVHAVRALARGQRYLCPAVARCVADSISREALTPREVEVLMQVADGLGNKAIARRLCIAVGTVKTHVKSVLGKLGVTSRTQAISVAIARGLVKQAQHTGP